MLISALSYFCALTALTLLIWLIVVFGGLYDFSIHVMGLIYCLSWRWRSAVWLSLWYVASQIALFAANVSISLNRYFWCISLSSHSANKASSATQSFLTSGKIEKAFNVGIILFHSLLRTCGRNAAIIAGRQWAPWLTQCDWFIGLRINSTVAHASLTLLVHCHVPWKLRSLSLNLVLSLSGLRENAYAVVIVGILMLTHSAVKNHALSVICLRLICMK